MNSESYRNKLRKINDGSFVSCRLLFAKEESDYEEGYTHIIPKRFCINFMEYNWTRKTDMNGLTEAEIKYNAALRKHYDGLSYEHQITFIFENYDIVPIQAYCNTRNMFD